MHTNLDFAIASVIEHGQALDIPNVFAAYLQRVIACELSDGSTITETEAIARAALVSFERAMDKYPMAPPARRPPSARLTSPSTHVSPASIRLRSRLPRPLARRRPALLSALGSSSLLLSRPPLCPLLRASRPLPPTGRLPPSAVRGP